ncbi:EcsC family protein [Oscillospiraceae bacterium PP1C4]
MNLYEKHVEKELSRWHKEIIKSAGLFERTSKGIQNQTQKLVPHKIQSTITAAVEKMTQTILFGSGMLTIKEDTSDLSLAERDFLVQEQFQVYMKTAIAQGVGFGAGGILLGLADLPALMGIKIKFLFDSAKLYGYDTDDQNERLFLLYVFQLAFSSREHRMDVFRMLEKWDRSDHLPMDWEKFQIEYRDYLDIAKLLQLLPVVGSVVGGTSNYKLMNRLKINVMNCYRMRITGRKWPENNHL